jgi:hypothetical protein
MHTAMCLDQSIHSTHVEHETSKTMTFRGNLSHVQPRGLLQAQQSNDMARRGCQGTSCISAPQSSLILPIETLVSHCLPILTGVLSAMPFGSISSPSSVLAFRLVLSLHSAKQQIPTPALFARPASFRLEKPLSFLSRRVAGLPIHPLFAHAIHTIPKSAITLPAYLSTGAYLNSHYRQCLASSRVLIIAP